MEVLGELKDIDFVSLSDLGYKNDTEENGETYEANSLIKAEHFYKKTGMITMGEDSGIEVEALQNELGVHTRRWGAGEDASDEEWLTYFLRRMKQEGNKRAKFVCVPTIIWGEGLESRKQFRGETWGEILDEPECDLLPGIPISSVFRADGSNKVYAALSTEEKNQISHRGKAMGEVKEFLRANFSNEGAPL